MASYAVLAAYALPLVLAAASDLRSFRIPNALVAALALLYPLSALLLGRAADLPVHCLAALLVLGAGVPFFALRVVGAGDVKLLSAVALWLGMAPLPDFLLDTATLGGVFAIALLAARRFANSRRAPIPYGVPIAAAGLVMARAIFTAS